VLSAVVLGTVGLLLSRDRPPSGPPANASLRLVPDDALVVVHLNDGAGRGASPAAVRDVDRRLGDLGLWARARDALATALRRPGCRSGPSVVPGGEGSYALLPVDGGRAAPLVVVDTGGTVERPVTRTCGRYRTTVIGRHLVAGTRETVARARDLHERRPRHRSLLRLDAYRRLTDALPDDRAVDAWASPAGIRRLLAPAGGPVGALGAALDRTGSEGAAIAIAPVGDDGVRVAVRTRGTPGGGRPFRADAVAPVAPSDAVATLVTVDPVGAIARAARMLGSGDPGGAGELVSGLPATLRRIDRLVAGRLRRDVADAVTGPSEVVVTAGRRRPAVVVVTPLTDGARAVRTLREVRDQLADALNDPGSRRRFTRSVVAGRPAWTLRVGARGRVGYLRADDRLVAYTDPAAAAAVLRTRERLAADERWRGLVDDGSKSQISIGFAEFTRVVAVADRSGLATDPEYRTVRRDLGRLRALTLRADARERETSTDLDLWIR